MDRLDAEFCFLRPGKDRLFFSKIENEFGVLLSNFAVPCLNLKFNYRETVKYVGNFAIV